jgi:hypothetical protein
MSQLSVSMTADEADLFAKLTTMIAKVGEGEAAFKKAGETSNAAAAASKAAAEQAEALARSTAKVAKENEAFASSGKRLADQLLKSNETLEESYRRQETQIKAAYDSGKIGATEYEKSLLILKNKHEEQQAAAIKGAKEQQEAVAKAAREQQEATQRMALESSRSYQIIQRESQEGVNIAERLRRSNETLEQQYRQMGLAVTLAHRSGKLSAEEHEKAIRELREEYRKKAAETEKAVGPTFQSMAMGAIGKWGSIAGAISIATEFIRIQNEEIQKGTDALKARENATKDLATVSDSPLEMTERQMQAKELSTKFGIPVEKAINTVFALDSMGLIGTDKTTAENFALSNQFGRYGQVSDPEQLAKIAGSLNQSTGLTPAQGANLAAVASQETKVTIDQLAKEMETAMAGAIMFSQADKEDLATQTAALTSYAAKTQANAGTLVKGAFMKLAPTGRDKSPLQALAETALMDDTAIKEKYGESEPLQVMVQLYRNNFAEFERIAAAGENAVRNTGTADDHLESKVRFFETTNPGMVAVNEARKAEAARNYAAEKPGSVAQANKAEYDAQVARLNSSGMSDFIRVPMIATAGAISTFADTFGIQLRGGESAGLMRSGNDLMEEQITAAREGRPIPGGRIHGLSDSEQAKHDAVLKEFREMNAGIKAMQASPAPVTRPGDDR